MSVFLSRYLYFPLAEALKRTPVTRYLRDLESSQWQGDEELEGAVRGRLAQVLNAAREEVDYYRRRLSALGEITPATVLDALRRIPVLTRSEVFLHREALCSRAPVGRVLRGRTSGSSGEALEFLFTPEFLARTEAAQWRGRGWWGMRRGERMLTLWGRTLFSRGEAERVVRRERRRNWLRVSAFQLGPRDLAALHPRIAWFRPSFIYGYSSAIYQLALFYAERRLPPPSGLRAVFFTADALFPAQRRLVEETLRAPLACEYGSSEAGAFAFECRQGGVHVSSRNVHLEILRDGAPVPDGEEGEVVVTVLINRVMPLIRYNLGDWARRVPGPCACGRRLPRIELTNTKVVDMIHTSAGGVASGHLFDYILIELLQRGARGIRKFLVIQKALDRFLVQVVPGPLMTAECLAIFERRMREQLGNHIRVEFQQVAEIPPERGGKIRYFRSEIGARPRSPLLAPDTPIYVGDPS